MHCVHLHSITSMFIMLCRPVLPSAMFPHKVHCLCALFHEEHIMCSAMFALCAPIECTLAKCAALSVGSVTLLPAVGQLLLARPQLKAELDHSLNFTTPPHKFARSLFSPLLPPGGGGGLVYVTYVMWKAETSSVLLLWEDKFRPLPPSLPSLPCQRRRRGFP